MASPLRSTTLVAALTTQGIAAAMTMPGTLDSEAFDVFLEQVLVPQLTPGLTAVLDNLSVHVRATVRKRIEAAQCQLRYLPAYSPDFNPIEHAFSKLKGYLRRAEARAQVTLDAATTARLTRITTADAQA